MNLHELKPFFENEINIDACNDTLTKMLLILKLKCGVSLRQEDDPVFQTYYHPISLEGIKNAIVFSNVLGRTSDVNNYQKDISFYLNQQISNTENIAIYIDKQNKTTVIKCSEQFITEYNMRLVASILIRLLPWYFKETVSADFILKIADALNENFYEFLESELEKEIERCGIKQEILFNEAMKLMDTIAKNRIDNFEYEIQQLTSRINEMMKNLAELSALRRNKKENLEGVISNAEARQRPILDVLNFIKQVKDGIKLEQILGSSLYFSIRSEMTEFEDAEYQGYVINNTMHDSYFFDGVDVPYEDLRMLYKAIFETRKIKVYFATYISLNIKNGCIDKYIPSKRIDNCMNHPHLANDVFCMGNNEEYISQYITENRFVDAINLILYSSKQFTIGDTYVGKIFIENLFSDQCIEMPSGEYMDGYEAVEYMKAHKEEFADD